MATPQAFDYTVIRVVPREDRGEFINVGVILFSPSLGFLDARVRFEPERLLALAPGIDVELVRRHLEVIPRICAGAADAGPIGALPPAGRFHWLAAPRSTLVQTSPVHCGLTDDPAASLDHLMHMMVERPDNQAPASRQRADAGPRGPVP